MINKFYTSVEEILEDLQEIKQFAYINYGRFGNYTIINDSCDKKRLYHKIISARSCIAHKGRIGPGNTILSGKEAFRVLKELNFYDKPLENLIECDELNDNEVLIAKIFEKDEIEWLEERNRIWKMNLCSKNFSAFKLKI